MIGGIVPSPADCFTPRPQTGPGPLDALPPGQWLVLAAPQRRPKPIYDWPGGTGRTQLAAHLARTWYQGHPDGLLIWLTASSRDAVLSGYVQAAAAGPAAMQANDAETTAARFVSWLAETSEPWLVVLDGLSDPADLDGLWPGGPAGRVLVTAATAGAAASVPNPLIFPVGMYSSHEALGYLMARLSADPDQRLGAMDLVDDLGCDPLALAQASAAIANSGVACRDYREMFAEQRDQIAESAGVAPAAKAVTWTLSLECADELSPGGLPQSCLALAALLGCQGIPETVFSTRAVAEFIAGSTGAQGDPARVRSALAALESTGLLAIESGNAAGLVRVHPAVQAAVMSAMPQAMQERTARAAADALLQVWPDNAERSLPVRALRGCVASLERAAGDALWADGSRDVLFRAGRSLDDARLTGPAVSHWRAVAGASDRLLGPSHPDTVVAATRLAGAALAAGLGDDAVTYYQRALDTQTGLLGPDHPRTAAAPSGSRRRPARRRAARGGHRLPGRRARRRRPRRPRPWRPGWPRPAGQPGRRLSGGRAIPGRQPASRAHPRRAGARPGPGPRRDHAHPPDSWRAPAWPRAANKDAVSHGRRALAGAERVLGPDHPDTIDAVSVLASAYHSSRRLKDAIPLYERALGGPGAAREGPTIRRRSGCAAISRPPTIRSGRMATALELYERTRADCQRALGPDHPDTLAARTNLAHAYYAMGRTAEASTILEKTLADCERVLAPGDPLTAAVRDSLDAVSRG